MNSGKEKKKRGQFRYDKLFFFVSSYVVSTQSILSLLSVVFMLMLPKWSLLLSLHLHVLRSLFVNLNQFMLFELFLSRAKYLAKICLKVIYNLQTLTRCFHT